ncbi:MAG TPA: response regulator transcription factor [Clostridiales bacterium]|nr:response regulator transcription factor [Clostridiales bacterium]
MLSQSEWLSINEIIFSIYAIPDMTKMRKVFLDALHSLIFYDSALFDFAITNNRNPLFFDPVSVNIHEKYIKNYYEYFQHIDYTRWIFFQPNPIIYRDTDLLSNKLRESTEYFKNWMRPTNTYYGAGSAIISDGTLLGSVTLFRSAARDNFSERDLFILEILNSHLSNRLSQAYPQGIKNNILQIRQSDSLMENYGLTSRELEIIQFVSNGMSNQEISRALFISETTVKKHLNNIFKKLSINSRTQLMKFIYANFF